MRKQIKIEIKNRWTGNVLFKYSSNSCPECFKEMCPRKWPKSSNKN